MLHIGLEYQPHSLLFSLFIKGQIQLEICRRPVVQTIVSSSAARNYKRRDIAAAEGRRTFFSHFFPKFPLWHLQLWWIYFSSTYSLFHVYIYTDDILKV